VNGLAERSGLSDLTLDFEILSIAFRAPGSRRIWKEIVSQAA